MTDPLTQIYVQQQRELNEIERHRRLQAAKREREINAFMTSGLPAMFIEFADIELRSEVVARVYKKYVGNLTWDHCDPRTNRVSAMSLKSPYGGDRDQRWRCEEDADSGNMRYFISGDGRGPERAVTQDDWLQAFVDYLARACDPSAVAHRVQERQQNAANEPAASGRRQLQPL